ncbi:MAG: hypothetical protein OEY44_02995 [Candidatus Peregrinibacteria bacterium]|nr:hypothetical protein [Candidatus Peregrinibacteria bacterium]
MNPDTFVDQTINFVQPILASLTEFGTTVLGFIPNLIGALLLIFIGKMIAGTVEKALVKLLNLLKIEKVSEKIGITDGIHAVGLKIKTADIFGILAYWVVYLVFILAAVEVLGVETISDIVGELIAYIPNVIAGLLIMLIGLTVANFIRQAISHIKHGKILGKIAYFVILVVVSVSALEQIGIAISFFTENVQIIVAGFALAFGLAFGLGSKDAAKELVDGFMEKNRK